MDFRGLLFVMLVVLNVVCAALITAAQEDPNYDQLSSGASLTMKKLEKHLRDNIEQDLQDLRQYEMELKGNYFKMQNKKRQLEIRKRQPVQCLVNIVSCWRRK